MGEDAQNEPAGISPTVCTLCLGTEVYNSEHALLTCNYIKVGADNLLLALQQEINYMTLERIKFLNFRSEDLYPMTFLTASILEQLGQLRSEKNIPGLLYTLRWNLKFCS